MYTSTQLQKTDLKRRSYTCPSRFGFNLKTSMDLVRMF